MAIQQKTRLFKVTQGERSNLCGIEATDAEEAIKRATSQGWKNITKVESEPIFEASLGLEFDTEEAKTENGLFDLVIRGTDEKLVDRLRDAIAIAIGGMGPDMAELSDGTPNVSPLVKFLRDSGLNIVAM